MYLHLIIISTNKIYLSNAFNAIPLKNAKSFGKIKFLKFLFHNIFFTMNFCRGVFYLIFLFYLFANLSDLWITMRYFWKFLKMMFCSKDFTISIKSQCMEKALFLGLEIWMTILNHKITIITRLNWLYVSTKVKL